MSWINPNLNTDNSEQLEELQNEITDIGEFVGYYWKFIQQGPSTITGNNTDGFNASFPIGNDTSFAYSNFQKTNFEIDFVINFATTNNIFVGITENPDLDFAPSSYPSMDCVLYGLLIDQNSSNEALFKILSGVASPTSFKWGTNYKITYDGINLRFFVDNSNVLTYNVNLSPCNIVIGSVYGGVINNIFFTGSSSGEVGANLSDILKNGNSAEGQNILDINSITVNTNINLDNLILNANNEIFQYANTTDTGLIFDTVINPVSLCINTTVNNLTSKVVNGNSSTSILSFSPNKKIDNCTYFTLNFNSLSFTFDRLSVGVSTPETIFIFITDTLDGDFDENEVLNIGYLTPDLNLGSGGNPEFSKNSILLSFFNDTSTPTGKNLYLNIKVNSSSNSFQYKIDTLDFVSQILAQNYFVEIYNTPNVLI